MAEDDYRVEAVLEHNPDDSVTWRFSLTDANVAVTILPTEAGADQAAALVENIESLLTQAIAASTS